MKRILGEFLGTYFLVLVGTGSILLFEGVAHSNWLVALGFWLGVFIPIMTVGHWSGAHINPAVTVFNWIQGKISHRWVAIYVFFQLSGASMASFCLLPFSKNKLGQTHSIDYLSGFCLEWGMTILLLFGIIWGLKLRRRLYLALLVATIVFFEAALAGSLTGASMNPARSFGPAFIAQDWHQHSLYWLAPIGAAISFGIQQMKLKQWKNAS